DAPDGAGLAAPAPPLPVDLAANAQSLGAQVIRAGTIDEVRDALARAHGAAGPVVVHVEVDRYAGVPSYDGWWDVPVAEGPDAAVRAAREALPKWRAVATIARARKLFELRERLVARQEDLARSVTVEMGKTIVDARAEVARMIEMVECACAIPTTMQGRVLEDVSRNIDAETVRQPVGVCAAIVPFNFPAMVPFWFLPFAIACGNTFVLKPSEQVPL